MCSLVHGFESPVYEVNEGGVVELIVNFRTNVKGRTPAQQRAETGLIGTLRAVPDGTASE